MLTSFNSKQENSEKNQQVNPEMTLLRMGQDIEFSGFDRETAKFRFDIVNQAAVDAFLGNQALMSFLTDTWDANGRRLIIKQELSELLTDPRYIDPPKERVMQLTIARQMGPSTIWRSAFNDVRSALINFIAPYAANNEANFHAWIDMAEGQDPATLEFSEGWDSIKGWDKTSRPYPFVLAAKSFKAQLEQEVYSPDHFLKRAVK